MSDLRVLEVIPSLWTGGLERIATQLTLLLRERVAAVAVASSGGDPFTDVVREAGVRLHPIPRPWPRPIPVARAAAALVPVLRRERPHVVHAHNPGAAAAAALARLAARMPDAVIVTTFHGVEPDRVPRAARVLARTSDVVVAVAPAATEALVAAGVPRERTATIPNAVAPVPARPAADVRAEFGAEGRDLVVTVGRYTAQKNQAVLLEALARLPTERRSRVRALLVGVGELEDDLRSAVATLGLGDTATVVGERFDAVDITAAAHVFVLSSDWEGLPLALLEAMSLGRAIVATSVDGIADALQDDVSGVLVPPRDPEALAAALDRVLADPSLRASLAAGAAERARTVFSEEAMAVRYLELFGSARDARIRRRSGASPS